MIKKRNKIYLISSGTGGHAMPVFCIYKKLISKKSNQIKILYSGSTIEKNIFKNIEKTKIYTGKFKRYSGLGNIWQGIKLGIGLVQSFFILTVSRPDLIFSKGGFISVPILYVAKMLRIPYFIHESDSALGLSNQMFFKDAKYIFLSFPLDIYSEDLSRNGYYSGLIIRDEVKNILKIEEKNKNIIFITGGSQGARVINRVIFNILPKLLKQYEVIHQVGEGGLDEAKKATQKVDRKLLENYQYYSFSTLKTLGAFALSDLIITRAGATTIGEIAATSKAAILIPYKYASQNHQIKNARYLEKVGAAIMIKERNFNSDTLYDRIVYLLSDKRNIDTLGKNIHGAVKTNGLDIVCQKVEKFLNK